MTKPDEALLWAREQSVEFWEQSGAAPKDVAYHIAASRSGEYDADLEPIARDRREWLDGHRAGAAASDARIKALEEALKDSVTAMRLLLDAVQKHNAESDTFLSGFPLHLLSIEIAAARALLKEDDQ
jgi:hypothetical protein